MFAGDDRVFGKERRSVMQAKVGNAHRKMRADGGQDGGLAAQGLLRLLALRKLEDETVVHRDGTRMPAARQRAERGIGKLGMNGENRGTGKVGFAGHGLS
jgi:hypothetical protein